MLTRNPKEFERVAQEWAVKYAGAPKKEAGESSGGSKSETKKQKQQRSLAEEAAERAALFVHIYPASFRGANLLPDTAATTSR